MRARCPSSPSRWNRLCRPLVKTPAQPSPAQPSLGSLYPFWTFCKEGRFFLGGGGSSCSFFLGSIFGWVDFACPCTGAQVPRCLSVDSIPRLCPCGCISGGGGVASVCPPGHLSSSRVWFVRTRACMHPDFRINREMCHAQL